MVIILSPGSKDHIVLRHEFGMAKVYKEKENCISIQKRFGEAWEVENGKHKIVQNYSTPRVKG